jgi:signal transduction histidine kinase
MLQKQLAFMKKFGWVLVLLAIGNCCLAQIKVKFILKEQTCLDNDSVYITGTFSNWDSTGNVKYLLKPQGPKTKSITLDLPAGDARYKFTRGTWHTVEKHTNGEEVVDRTIRLRRDTVLTDSVSAWRDQITRDKWCQLQGPLPDTARVLVLAALATIYAFFPEYYKVDSAFYYAQTALQLQQQVMQSPKYQSLINEGLSSRLIRLQEILATLLHSLGNYSKSLSLRFENLKLAEAFNDPFLRLATIRFIAYDYMAMKDYESVLKYGKLMKSTQEALNAKNEAGTHYLVEKWFAYNLIATAYYHLDSLDLALQYATNLRPPESYAQANGDLLLADIYAKKGDQGAALQFYRASITQASRMYAYQLVAKAYRGMARVFKNQNRLDSALIYARRAMEYFQNNRGDVQAWGENSEVYIADISPLLAELYKANNEVDSAYKYLLLSINLKDSLYNDNKVRQFQTLGFNEETRRKELENEKEAAREQLITNIKLVSLVASLLLILVVAIVLYRNNRQKQKANKILEETLANLKSAQAQLIQSEKMASLGELTAGIAHEIQNPLNFVNNFSEVNNELITEMDELLEKGATAEARLVANDIKLNLEKITHHGKRADGIVKGMLQHSSSGNGAKEPTDINKLADEYIRLAYHGLRARDKSFNATFKTHYDESIDRVNIVPQDISRVVLNLITNAFYAVDEKKKSGIENYEPTVSLTTRNLGEKVELKVADNGKGIPQKILDKIFQPFFTTKPTGQGTGLGLSLSYDIVKAHGGELKVETAEGEGAAFIIRLPA